MKRFLLILTAATVVTGCNTDTAKQKPESNKMEETFTPVPWAHHTNIYEVNTRQYTAEGTFNAFAKELPRLKDMGVQTIWFMPVTPISSENRKGSLGSYYACSDYMAINPEFGTLEDFKTLVKEAHAIGLKVIIDWVANHTGWDHVWTKTNPDFYTKNEQGGFRPPFPEWGDVIDLDYDNAELQLAMIEAMKFWVKECDLDGFRCDMAHLVPVNFWKEARARLDSIKPLFWLAETEDPAYHDAFDVSYAWKLLHKMEQYWRKETDIRGLDSVLKEYTAAFPPSALQAFFTSNHDENSHSGSEYERMGDAAKPFAVFCATWNSVPLIYSGQELPLINKRLQFFERDPIPWTGKNELHDFYKALLNLRATHPAMRAGDVSVTTSRVQTNKDDKIFAYTRKKENREVLVILNLSGEDNLQFEIPGAEINGSYKNIFTDAPRDLSSQKTFQIKSWGWLVFEK
jgi:glycosidase